MERTNFAVCKTDISDHLYHTGKPMLSIDLYNPPLFCSMWSADHYGIISGLEAFSKIVPWNVDQPLFAHLNLRPIYPELAQLTFACCRVAENGFARFKLPINWAVNHPS